MWSIASETEVNEGGLTAELRFLEREIYQHEVELRRDVLTAYEPYLSISAEV